LGKKSVIGDYYVMFQKRSEFIYKALTQMECFALRKKNFFELVERYPEMARKLKFQVLRRYKDIIRVPLVRPLE